MSVANKRTCGPLQIYSLSLLNLYVHTAIIILQNFKFSTIDLEVTFPRVYPTVPLSITIPNDQGLHPTYIAHSNQAVSRYLATAPAGSGELMFRPFLRWFDKTITSVLKDAAKQVRRIKNTFNVEFLYL